MRSLIEALKAVDASVLDRYPKLKARMARENDPYSVTMNSLDGFAKYAKPGKEKAYLEAVAVYFVLTHSFDDVGFSKVVRSVGKVRKALGGSILDAYEKGGSFVKTGSHKGIRDAVVAAGLASDRGRLN